MLRFLGQRTLLYLLTLLFVGYGAPAFASGCDLTADTVLDGNHIVSFQNNTDYNYVSITTGTTFRVCDFESDASFTSASATIQATGGNFYRAINGTSGGSGSSICNNFTCTIGHYYLAYRYGDFISDFDYIFLYSDTNGHAVPINAINEAGTCTTCTRITATNPAGFETVATSTFTPFQFDYYIANDDFIAGETRIKYSYKHALQNQLFINEYVVAHGSASTSVITAGNGSFTDIVNGVIFNGTYYVNIQIYNHSEPSWWNFWTQEGDTLLTSYDYQFYANSSTSVQQLIDQQQLDETNSYFLDTSVDESRWALLVSTGVNTITHTPPIGYATRIYEIMIATSTGTTSMAIDYVISDDLPMGGRTLTLDTGHAMTNFYTQIDGIDADFIPNFMHYWNLAWYTVLIFWMMAQIFKISLHNNESQNEYNERKKS